MPFDPNKHRRRSIRLRGYDYATPGAYFVTICAQGRQRLFGTIANGAMQPNDARRMVERWWGELNNKFPAVRTDAFVVMPDHIHGIVVINASGDFNPAGHTKPPPRNDIGDFNPADDIDADAAVVVGAHVPIRPRRDANVDNDADAIDAGGDHDAVSLSRIIQWFKIMTSTEYIRQVKQAGWPPFARRVWQRGYYERIVRDDQALARIRHYIRENPVRWAGDPARLDALLTRMQAKE